jgi:hydroxyethylthiazole kinase-like uncharacterized protein yjeF
VSRAVYLTQDIRRIEQANASLPLMERAGAAAAELAATLVSDKGKDVLVLAGPGNNGGDALIAARQLKEWFYRVDVVFPGQEKQLPPDAAEAMRAWRSAGGSYQGVVPEAGDWGLIIDGLFGIGLTRPLESPYAELVTAVNALGLPILALDMPSGLDADGGRAWLPTIRATHTLTFLTLKPGLVTADGPDHVGQLHLRTLDVTAPMYYPASGWLLDRDLVAGLLPRRALNTHKGAFGSVGILGGAPSMMGASLLAGRAALKLGAGRVYVSNLDENAPAVDFLQPELMLRKPAHLFELGHLSCLVAGPGMGRSAAAGDTLAQALQSELPLVLDADALNLISASPELQEFVKQRVAATAMTPHPAEGARLLGATIGDVLYQRVEVANIVASRFNAFVALKGAGTVCAMPNGTYFINSSGNPGLASAGTGDVLSGFIGALIAQGLPVRDALLLGVYLHGAAADRLVQQGIGPIGMTASDVIDAGRAQLNEWVYGPVSR